MGTIVFKGLISVQRPEKRKPSFTWLDKGGIDGYTA